MKTGYFLLSEQHFKGLISMSRIGLMILLVFWYPFAYCISWGDFVYLPYYGVYVYFLIVLVIVPYIIFVGILKGCLSWFGFKGGTNKLPREQTKLSAANLSWIDIATLYIDVNMPHHMEIYPPLTSEGGIGSNGQITRTIKAEQKRPN